MAPYGSQSPTTGHVAHLYKGPTHLSCDNILLLLPLGSRFRLTGQELASMHPPNPERRDRNAQAKSRVQPTRHTTRD